ncbi:NUC173-domain-containing protein [Irpex rosettiformis]|uniref:NUC173-domain-containing protein n=1 Tax=Irpex rosettiformis TaxID=378272 RepID=A0ACB8U101_9APHY|nr:NUC173-domain-containing protein [Irpex rosettiformis]
MADDLEQALSKIRPHTSSSLSHQKAPATLLKAIEATFHDQNAERSPTAYFAALLTTLDGSLQVAQTTGPALNDGDVLPAELYLLALVTPFVPPPVIRTNLNTLLSLTAPLFPLLVPHAPPLRSQLTIYASLFNALEKAQLETPGLRQAFGSILHLCLDPRPKVRKKAAELVKDVLAQPPPPMIRHPYAERVAEWTINSLSEMTAGGLPKFKGKKAETDGSDTAIHLLAFLRPILSSLPSSALPTITTALLGLPRLGNPYLSQSAYSILAELVSVPTDDPTANVHSQLPAILKAVQSSSLSKTDSTLAPAWANVLANVMLAYQAFDSAACSSNLGDAWKSVWFLLDSSDASVRKSASESLALLTRCFSPSLIEAAVKGGSDSDPKAVIKRIVLQADKALDSLTFARALPELLAVISSLITGLRYRSGSASSPAAAEYLMLPIIHKIAELRVQKTFEYKEAADAVLLTAMHILGPHVILRELPLNLEPADRKAGKEPRAFLLPMLSQPHPSPLSQFVSYFVPLTERMFDLQQIAEAEGRQSEAKVRSVLVDQIWSGLHGYCYGTVDLKKALTPEFSQLLSQLLYSQPELRPAVLKALRVLVESNIALASGDEEQLKKLPEAARDAPISRKEATANIAFLQTQVESWLAVLFNVFSSSGRDAQGAVADVITVWVSIADAKEIVKAYQKLVSLLKQNLTSGPSQTQGGKDNSVTAMTLDLLVIILPHLSPVDGQELFEICLANEITESKDNAVQKRGYKILGKLIEHNKASSDPQQVLQKMDSLLGGLASAAKKACLDRFILLTLLVSRIPPTSLHLLPSIIPEAVLGTKEPSEKARTAAFDLVVAMGRKMSEGGVVRRDLLEGMDEDGASQATANIEEYMTMIAGGLAGATPHMISATVTAISRLVFEFQDAISPQMHTEIFTTLLVFVTSNNREIVKSALGYIKLAIHTMPVEMLRPHLKQLVPALLSWSHDHKNHFKSKVRHIFERMIRRFGWEDVYACAEDDDAHKILLNIKKRKDRAKRKKAQSAADEEDGENDQRPTGDAFEDVLYGSESELDDSDEEESTIPANRSGKRKGETGARLRIDGDNPMDLLSGAASQMTNDASRKRKKPGQDASRFKTDIETDKMVIGDNDEEEDMNMEEDVEGTAYRETITSADGFTRGPNGRVKFNKDTKKRRRDAEADEDVEMGEAQATSAKNAKRRSESRFGQEFKAKKAGGDVKKGGVDPYAYLPLSQAAKKKSRREKIGIAGKR